MKLEEKSSTMKQMVKGGRWSSKGGQREEKVKICLRKEKFVKKKRKGKFWKNLSEK